MSGRIVILGSGETAPTMIKPHRMLLESMPAGSAVMLDTPYGFQENADEITERARHYFRTSVGHEVRVASWRRADIDNLARERALTTVREAGWIFAGPGSPTYALRAWRGSALPGVLGEAVSSGATLVFASAAALTLGSHTVPVYEIYKAGISPYWEPGLDLVASLTGMPAIVIPHYDNAEGGHHDTRFCYLGERRLAELEVGLPEDAFVLGVDEHTALILDLATGTAGVLGNGAVTVRRRGASTVCPSGTVLSLSDLAPTGAGTSTGLIHRPPFTGLDAGGPGADRPSDRGSGALSVRAAADQCRKRFSAALRNRDVDAAVVAMLDLEQALVDWAGDTLASRDGEHTRGLLRSMVVELGDLARAGSADPAEAVRPFVDLLVALRDRARVGKDFALSDEIREHLASAGVELRDTPEGPEWSLTKPQSPPFSR